MVKDFWSRMLEMAYYRRQQNTEEKHGQLVEFVLKDILTNITVDDTQDTKTIDSEDQEDSDRCVNIDDYKNEISDLIQEGEMPLDELLEKYTSSGPYNSTLELPLSSPDESLSCDEDTENDSVEATECRPMAVDATAGETDDDDDTDVVVKAYHSLQELIQLAQNVHPVGHNLTVSPVNINSLSPLIVKPLREYQLIGSDWLTTMYHLVGGCLLCDGPSLGKKVQVIGFLAHLAIDRGVWGRHLIVIPSICLPAWQAEFERWYPASKVLVYCGQSASMAGKRPSWSNSECHILITSYQILRQDFELFKNKKWKCLVIDDVNCVVNSEVWSLLLNLTSDFTVQLTSSDVINDCSSSSLMEFLRLSFPRSCRDDLNGQLRTVDPETAKQVALAVMLRRSQDDVQCQLPNVTTHYFMSNDAEATFPLFGLLDNDTPIACCHSTA
jgi:SNF2 family DNA or RNA helicase